MPILVQQIIALLARIERRNAWPGGMRQRWGARVGNRASKPLPLDAAKRAVASMLAGKAEPRDWIGELNRIAANEVDRAGLEQKRKLWPLELTGAKKHPGSKPIDHKLRHAILNAELPPPDAGLIEPRQGDGYQLEYYADGYPRLPACLDRKQCMDDRIASLRTLFEMPKETETFEQQLRDVRLPEDARPWNTSRKFSVSKSLSCLLQSTRPRGARPSSPSRLSVPFRCFNPRAR